MCIWGIVVCCWCVGGSWACCTWNLSSTFHFTSWNSSLHLWEEWFLRAILRRAKNAWGMEGSVTCLAYKFKRTKLDILTNDHICPGRRAAGSKLCSEIWKMLWKAQGRFTELKLRTNIINVIWKQLLKVGHRISSPEGRRRTFLTSEHLRQSTLFD